MDRKYARWAKENIDKEFFAIVSDPESTPIAIIEDEIQGARVFLPRAEVELFEKIYVKIIDADIATTKIIGKITRRAEDV